MSAFDHLRQPDRPIAPDRRFADDLRARLTAELVTTIDLPDRAERTTVSNATDTATDTNATPEPATNGIVPYLAIRGAAEAIDWYVEAFGATEITRFVGDDDGRVGHAELRIGSGTIYLSDEYPEMGVTAPPSIGGHSAAFVVDVADVDEVHAAAVRGGGTSLRPPEDQPYGDRSATIMDPFGHRWMVQSPISQPTIAELNENMDGFTVTGADPQTTDEAAPAEIGYVTLNYDDTERAAAFYGAVFGWRAEQGHAGPGYAHVGNTRLPIGMTPNGSGTAPSLYVRVVDADACAALAVERGGSIVHRFEAASGINIECVDDQGAAFTIWQPAPGY